MLWALACGCGGRTLSPWPACPVGAACRGGGEGLSPEGVACHRCEGRLVSGAVPPPAARPLGRAAGVPRPVCPWCGRCGLGDPAPAPRRAPLRAGFARRGGGGRASPGGVPSAVVRGVWGQVLPLQRLPAFQAGCRGSLATCCGRGCWCVRCVWCLCGACRGPWCCFSLVPLVLPSPVLRCGLVPVVCRVPAVPPSLLASLARLLATPCFVRAFVALFPFLCRTLSSWPACPVGAACRGGGGGPSPGGVACRCCEGRLVSGAVPPPAAHPLGRAAGVPRPVCSGCGRGGRGTQHRPNSVRPCGPALLAVGVAEGRPRGEVPSTVVRGVLDRALPLPRPPAPSAGCWGPSPTCCGRGRVAVGPACRGGGGGPSPGMWPATVARGVWCQALSLPLPPVLWGRRPGSRDPCVPDAVGAGVGTKYQPHSVRPCGPALLAVGVAEGRPRGGCLPLLRGASDVRRSPSPNYPPTGRAVGVRYPRAVGAGVWVWGPITVPSACMPCGGCVPRGWWGAVPGGGGGLPLLWGASAVRRCPSPDRPSSGAGSRGTATRVFRVQSVRAWGPSTGSTACALAGRRCSLWGWRKGVPGGGAFHRCEGRLRSGAPPPPTARPLGGRLGSATHVLWARVCGCGGPTLSPWPACPVEAACRGGGGGPSPGGAACHRCEGRLVSGAVPPHAAKPLGWAAGAPRPVCPGCGRCGRGDQARATQRAPLRAGVARCGGSGRASPGGVPSTVVRGV